jgi:hypothetical protein
VLARPGNPPDARYVMYYTASAIASSPWRGRQCVGIATSASPRGPFVDHSGEPAVCNVAAGGTIDASPYVATDGSLYLTYADDISIRAQRLTADGLAPAGDEHVLMDDNSGYAWEQPRIEGPSMFTAPNGSIVLFYSAGLFWQSTYSVGAETCDTPLGPCRHIYSTPVLATRGTMFAPGGQTPFQLADGSWELAFHSWSEVAGARSLRILPMSFPNGLPAVG